jgi:hypothetical protein
MVLIVEAFVALYPWPWRWAKNVRMSLTSDRPFLDRGDPDLPALAATGSLAARDSPER